MPVIIFQTSPTATQIAFQVELDSNADFNKINGFVRMLCSDVRGLRRVVKSLHSVVGTLRSVDGMLCSVAWIRYTSFRILRGNVGIVRRRVLTDPGIVRTRKGLVRRLRRSVRGFAALME